MTKRRRGSDGAPAASSAADADVDALAYADDAARLPLPDGTVTAAEGDTLPRALKREASPADDDDVALLALPDGTVTAAEGDAQPRALKREAPTADDDDPALLALLDGTVTAAEGDTQPSALKREAPPADDDDVALLALPDGTVTAAEGDAQPRALKREAPPADDAWDDDFNADYDAALLAVADAVDAPALATPAVAAPPPQQPVPVKYERRPGDEVTVNRSPVLTLWAAHVAMRLGHPRATALTLGRALANRFAVAKGTKLGVIGGAPASKLPPALQPVALAEVPTHPAVYLRQRALGLFGEVFAVELVPPGPTAGAPSGTAELRAVVDGRAVFPQQVQRSLLDSFGAALPAAEEAFRALAAARTPAALAREAYALYEAFRPTVPPGVDGWGAKGVLDLGLVRSLAS